MQDTPSTVSIAMRRVELLVQIGAHPWEQHPERRSRLHIDLTLTFGYSAYFQTHGGYVDYDPLRSFLKSLEERPHTVKLEDFARGILEACFKLTPAERVKLAVLKPDIFHEMDGVGMEFDVARTDFTR